jgi:CubicO group peptidase (beta-lactamase class C family)
MEVIHPTEAGLSTARLADTDSLIQSYVDRGQIAGAIVLIARHGQVAHLRCYGLRDVEAGQPMCPDTLFRIASMAKPITAVATMMLYEEGLLGLDDPIADYLPAFKDTPVYAGNSPSGPVLIAREREITVRHLLTHASGICLGADRDDALDALYFDAVERLKRAPGTTNQSAAQALAQLPLAFQPGTGWRYGLSFEVLAALIEVVSGQWFDVFLRQRIFQPLGMEDTGHIVPREKAPRLAALYGASPAGGLDLLESPAHSVHVLPPDFEFASGKHWLSGGGMMVSTVADYARFGRPLLCSGMLLNGGALEGTRLLRPETVALMTRNHVPDALLPLEGGHAGHGHGLGVQVVLEDRAGDAHAGAFAGSGGHGTYFWADPRAGLLGLLMLQLDPIPTPIHDAFRWSTYRALVE